MKTRRFCPHCGRPLLKSNMKGYAFQCFACNEDFWRFEVYRKKDLRHVKAIRKNNLVWEIKKDGHVHSIHKAYPKYR